MTIYHDDPRKLDCLKSGFGKTTFCSSTVFPQSLMFDLFGFSEFDFGASLSGGGGWCRGVIGLGV